MTPFDSPYHGSSMYVCRDDPEFFPDGFAWAKLPKVLEDLKKKGWKDGYIQVEGNGKGSTDNNIVAILYK